MHHDIEYLGTLNGIKMIGSERPDRTGTGTISVFSRNMDFNISRDFPLLLSKSIHWPSVVHELLWFLSGDTNVKYLQENGVRIWNEWATEEGELGPVYGAQWRNWECPGAGVHVDQIAELVNNLKNDPFSRRHIVSAWNPAVLPDPKFSPKENAENGLQALPPCHAMFQFYVEQLDYRARLRISGEYGIDWGNHTRIAAEEYEMKLMDEAGVPRLGLSCQMYQRSADFFLGVPFNIASYSLLTYLMAKTVDMHPMNLHWVGGDCHIYGNHQEQVTEQLKRMEEGQIPRIYPKVKIKTKRDRLEDYTFDDIELIGYSPLPAIKAPIAV
jgi:thymidylate synthase